MDQLHKIVKYLQGNATAEERAALIEWRKKSPENEALFESVSDIYAIEISPDEIKIFDTKKTWEEIDHLITDQKTSRISTRQWMGIAAVSLVLIALVFWMFSPDPLYKELITMENSERIKLPDHSVVELGPYSTLKYFTRIETDMQERIIYLTGEAKIEVSKHEKLSFMVATDKTGIKVLGTVFEVKQIDSIQTRVANLKGLIRFFDLKDEAKSIIIKKGESFIYDGHEFTNVTPVDPPEVLKAPEVKAPPELKIKTPVILPIAEPVKEEEPVEIEPEPIPEPPVDKTVYTSVEEIINELNNRFPGKFNTAPYGQYRFNARIPFDLNQHSELSLEDLLKALGKVSRIDYRQTCPDCFELLTLTSK